MQVAARRRLSIDRTALAIAGVQVGSERRENGVEPPYRLAFSWKWDGTDDEPTRVDVELSEAEGGTRMLLTHTGFATAEDAANPLMGWEPEMGRLAGLLTAQHPDPTPDRG